MKKTWVKRSLIILSLIILSSLVLSESTINPLTKGRADTLYCQVTGGCGAISDTNDSIKMDNIVATNCTGQVIGYFFNNGTGVCEADDTGAGGGDKWTIYTDDFINDSDTLKLNWTTINRTIDLRENDTDTDTDTWNTTDEIIAVCAIFNETWLIPTSTLNLTNDNDFYSGTQVNNSINVLSSGVDLNITFGLVVGATAGTYGGNISDGTLVGYSSGHSICANEYANSHFCMEVELLKTNELGAITGLSATYWYSVGAPGYTAEANSCSGHTTNSTTSLGAFWRYDLPGVGQGKLTNCAQEKQLLCCGDL